MERSAEQFAGGGHFTKIKKIPRDPLIGLVPVAEYDEDIILEMDALYSITANNPFARASTIHL